MVNRYNQNEINKLANILKNDGIISVPTDTVYGLCARINSINAYNKIMELKKRPQTKMLPIMCANVSQIKTIAKVNKKAEKLINAFMPGPVTLILKRKAKISNYTNNKENTIAVRMATSKALEELIEKTESPIFMTSANNSGEPTCISLEEIEKTFPSLDGMLEGEVSFNEASTIIDCTSEEVKILRKGPISIEEILLVLE